jgi:hypothetical protein
MTVLDGMIEFVELLYIGSSDPDNLPAIQRDLGKLIDFMREMKLHCANSQLKY